jgi:type II secretory pathway pseudopilin PulG
MRRITRQNPRRYGITLLELVIASSMLAVIGSSLSLVLRTARVSWETNDTEAGIHQHAQAVIMHVVRTAREARKVIAITATSVALETRSGETMTWTHQPVSADGRNGAVMVSFSSSGGQYPLAYDIRNLTFTGYQEDSTTITTDPTQTKMIQVSATVEIPGNAQRLQTISSRVWIRAW